MASTSASSAPAEGGPDPSIAHLPDASEELARTTDLTITVQGQELKLHRAVVASGSRVLRTALCACADSGDGGAAAAVQAAFEGSELGDVTLFLKMLYNANGLESGQVSCGTIQETDGWQGLLSLADKLDAHNVLQACDVYIARNLPVANRQDASFEATTDWLGWLLLADRLNMSRIAARCVAPLMKKMIASAVKQDVARLAQLSQPAAQVLLAVLLKGVKIAAIRNGSVASHLPFSVDWQAPENLF